MKTVNGNVKRRKTKKMSLFRYRLKLVLKYSTIFCIVAAVGVTLSFTVFFKIEKHSAFLPSENDVLMNYFFNGQVLMPSSE